MKYPKIKPLAVSILMALMVPSFAFSAEDQETKNRTTSKADETKGEVVVVVRKREENVMDVGVSMSVFSSDDIEAAAVADINDITNLTPGFTMAPLFGTGTAVPVIRGLSTSIGEPNVGFFIDGIYQSSRAQMEAMLGSNIARIEIAKGPQSALFGRNTFGGAVNFITKKPGREREGEIKLGYGNYNQQDFRINFSTPINDSNDIRFWYNHIARDGYYTNALTGKDLDDRQTDVLGFSLFGGEEEGFNYQLTFGADRARDGDDAVHIVQNNDAFGPPLGFPLPDFQLYTGDVPTFDKDGDYAVTPGHHDRDNKTSSLKLNWDLGGMSLTAITGYNNLSQNYLVDDDYTAIRISQTATIVHQNEFSQEIRLQSEDESTFQWTAGLYYYKLNTDSDVNQQYQDNFFFVPSLGGLDSIIHENTKSIAGFGSAAWSLGEAWKMILSGRYFSEKKSANTLDTNLLAQTTSTFDDSKTFNKFTPRLDIEYHLQDGDLVYGSVARAVKAGGFNTISIAGAISENDRTYDPESSMNYELGYKGSFMDDQIKFTSALFYIKWKDQIVRALGDTGQILNVNAAQTTSKGFEMELNSQLSDNLNINLGLAYTDATFDKYTFGALAGLGVNPVLDGVQLQFVSKWQYNATLDYQGGQVFEDFNWFTRFDVGYQSSQGIVQTSTPRAPARTLANLSLGVSNLNWKVQFWVKNLFKDDASLSGVFQPGRKSRALAFTGQAPGWQVFQGLVNAPNPRTYGVSLYYNF